jgi:hypothetical protein
VTNAYQGLLQQARALLAQTEAWLNLSAGDLTHAGARVAVATQGTPMAGVTTADGQALCMLSGPMFPLDLGEPVAAFVRDGLSALSAEHQRVIAFALERGREYVLVVVDVRAEVAAAHLVSKADPTRLVLLFEHGPSARQELVH